MMDLQPSDARVAGSGYGGCEEVNELASAVRLARGRVAGDDDELAGSARAQLAVDGGLTGMARGRAAVPEQGSMAVQDEALD